MENHKYHRLHSILGGLASFLSSLFFFSPPFEKNPQQCEMVQTTRKIRKDPISGTDEMDN